MVIKYPGHYYSIMVQGFWNRVNHRLLGWWLFRYVMDFYDLLTGIALAFVFEGLVWSVFTRQARDAALAMADMPVSTLRSMGVLAIFIGVVLVWFIRG